MLTPRQATLIRRALDIGMDVINQPMMTDEKLTKLVTMEQLVRAVREDVGEQGEGEHKTRGGENGAVSGDAEGVDAVVDAQ